MEGGGRKSTLVSKANAERHARVFSFRSSSDSQVVPPAKLEKREGKRSNCKKKKVRCKKEKKKREEETERKKRSFAGNDLMPSPFPYLKGREGRREGSRNEGRDRWSKTITYPSCPPGAHFHPSERGKESHRLRYANYPP